MRFSIIVANFNNSAFLPELLNSVLSQTHQDWELVIVDDCSSIDPQPYLEPFLGDARVRLIRHPVNRGAAQAFRTAAEASTGELIGMLGADDALLPEALARMAEAHARHPEASMVNSLSYLCDESLRILRVFDIFHRVPEGASLIHGVCVGNFATFKREAYLKTEGYDPRFQKALDHDIFLKLEEVGSLVFIDEPLYLYRSNPIGISQGTNSSRAAQFSLLARYHAYLRRRGTNLANLSLEEAAVIRKAWHIRELFNLRINGQRMAVLRAAWNALREYPGMIVEQGFLGNIFRTFIMLNRATPSFLQKG